MIIVQLLILFIICFGIYLSYKGHCVQANAIKNLQQLAGTKSFTQNFLKSLPLEEDNDMVRSLLGIRMKIIGFILIAIPASILILLHTI